MRTTWERVVYYDRRQNKTLGVSQCLLLNWRFWSIIPRFCLVVFHKILTEILCRVLISITYHLFRSIICPDLFVRVFHTYCQSLPDIHRFQVKTQCFVWFFVLFHPKSKNYSNSSFWVHTYVIAIMRTYFCLGEASNKICSHMKWSVKCSFLRILVMNVSGPSISNLSERTVIRFKLWKNTYLVQKPVFTCSDFRKNRE